MRREGNEGEEEVVVVVLAGRRSEGIGGGGFCLRRWRQAPRGARLTVHCGGAEGLR